MYRSHTSVITCLALATAVFLVADARGEGMSRPVTLHHGMSGGRLQMFRDVFLDPFPETYPLWRIEDTGVTRVGIAFRQHLLTGADLPDLAMAFRDDIPYLADAGRIYSINELVGGDIAALGIDEALIRWLTYKDLLWAIPLSANTRVLFCNPQLLDDAGLAGAPATWEEMTEFADQATRDTDSDGRPDVWGLHLGDMSATLRDFFFQADGHLDMSEAADVPVTPAAFSEAVSMMDDLRFRRGLLLGEHRADPLAGGFEAGIVAMEIDRIERARSITVSGTPFIIAPLPAGETAATGFVSDHVLVVCRRSRGEPQGALAFIRFLLDPERYTEWSRISGDIPPAPSIRSYEGYRDLAKSRPWVDVAANTIATTRFIPLQHGSEVVEAALRRQMSRVHERLAATKEEGMAALRRTIAAVRGTDDNSKMPRLDIRFLPSAVKLRPGERWRRYASMSTSIEMARGETESFQIVVTAPVGPVEITGVSVPTPRSRRNVRLSESKIDLFEQMDVNIEEPMAGAVPGPYPDPLVPLQGTKRVRPGIPLRLWVRLSADDGALPDVYESSIDVATGDGRVLSVPWNVRIDTVRVPRTPRLSATVGLNYDRLAARFGLTPGTSEWRRVADRYYEFLLDHRLTPFRPPVEAGQPGSRVYLSDPRVSAFMFPHDDDENKMHAVAEAFRAWGVQNKAFFYVEDEPFHAMYARVVEIGLLAQKVAPEFRYMMTTPPTSDMEGLVDTWCLHVGFRPISTPSAVDEVQSTVWGIAQARSRGERIWWYTAGAVTPLPTLHIDDDGVAPRVMPWLQPLYGVTGFLHWEAVNWVADPYSEPYVVPFGNGEGVLIYPPRDEGNAEPVTSIRLELLRDGLEDYELLDMLRRSIDAVKPRMPAGEWDYDGETRIREYAARFIRDEAREAAAYGPVFMTVEIDRDPARFAEMRRKLFAELDAVTTRPLALVATRPAEGMYTTGTTATIEVSAEENAAVYVNGAEQQRNREGIIQATVPLRPGPNPVTIEITRGGERKTIRRTLYRTGYDTLGSNK